MIYFIKKEIQQNSPTKILIYDLQYNIIKYKIYKSDDNINTTDKNSLKKS